MKNKNFLLLLLVIILFAGILFLFQKNNRGESEAKYRLGVILPETGKLSFMGEQERKGMELALEQLSNKDIEIVFEDCKSNAKDATSAALKLINFDNVDALLTSTTGVSKAILPITKSKGKELIAFCMDPYIAKNDNSVMRLYEGTYEEADAIVKYIVSEKSIDKVAILYVKVDALTSSVNNIIKPALIENNIELVFEEQYDIGEKNLRNIALKLRKSGANHIILLSYGFEFPILFPLFREYEIYPQKDIIGGWGFLYPQLTPKELEGVKVSGPGYIFSKGELANKFIADFEKKYGVKPNYDGAMAFNVVSLLGENIDEIKKKGIYNTLKNKKMEKSVLGKYYINQDGEMILETSLGVFRNGDIIKYR